MSICVRVLQLCVCVRALQMCVCVHALQMCVCVRAIQMCMRACASDVCVCTRFRCVCVHVLQLCVCVRANQMCGCACASDVCVCACASDACVCVRVIQMCVCVRALQMCVRETSHTACNCSANNPKHRLCSPPVLISSPDTWDWKRMHALVVMHRRTLCKNVDRAKIKVPFIRQISIFYAWHRCIVSSHIVSIYRWIVTPLINTWECILYRCFKCLKSARTQKSPFLIFSKVIF